MNEATKVRGAGDALRHLIEGHSRRFRELFAQALSGEEVEVIHDLRVCSRRLQQCLDAPYANARPREVRSAHRMLRRVRHALGKWRNCDVALELLDRGTPGDRNREDRERARVQDRRARQIARARRRLRREDVDRLGAAVRIATSRCGAGADVSSCVRLGVERAWREWRSSLSVARADPHVRNVHALRIATKRLRYRVELAGDLGEPRARAVLPWLEKLQDAIGRWHDRHVLRNLTRDAKKRSKPRDLEELTEILALGRKAKERDALKAWIATGRQSSPQGRHKRSRARRRR